MTRGNNNYGRAGKGGVPVRPLVEFLDHYTYTLGGEHGRTKYINGRPIEEGLQRQIRRWRNGHTAAVNPAHLLITLEQIGFSIAWYHKWCKDRGYGVSFR